MVRTLLLPSLGVLDIGDRRFAGYQPAHPVQRVTLQGTQIVVMGKRCDHSGRFDGWRQDIRSHPYDASRGFGPNLLTT